MSEVWLQKTNKIKHAGNKAKQKYESVRRAVDYIKNKISPKCSQQNNNTTNSTEERKKK